MSRRRLVLSLALGSVLALAVASVALGTHARPGSGTPLRVPLVLAYNECTTPEVNSTHVLPIALGSCTPPTLDGDMVTAGAGGLGSGSIKLSVICSVPGLPPCDPSDGVNEEDVRTEFFQSDVRCQKVDTDAGCPTSPGDYTGRFIARSLIRITDHANGGAACPFPNEGTSPCVTGTVQDAQFAVPTSTGSCVAVAPATSGTGSTCSFTTTINTAVPFFGGAVKEFQRGIVSVFGLNVLDAGEDNNVGAGCPPTCGTGDESKAYDQGIFIP
jgi:hypothetical protein